MNYRTEHLVLNGAFKLVIESTEFRISMWVNSFGLQNATTGRMIIPVIDFLNLESFLEEQATLHVKFRIYPDATMYYYAKLLPMEDAFVYENERYPLDNFYHAITGKSY